MGTFSFPRSSCLKCPRKGAGSWSSALQLTHLGASTQPTCTIHTEGPTHRGAPTASPRLPTSSLPENCTAAWRQMEDLPSACTQESSAQTSGVRSRPVISVELHQLPFFQFAAQTLDQINLQSYFQGPAFLSRLPLIGRLNELLPRLIADKTIPQVVIPQS